MKSWAVNDTGHKASDADWANQDAIIFTYKICITLNKQIAQHMYLRYKYSWAKMVKFPCLCCIAI